MDLGSKVNVLHSRLILDEARTPVARYRMLSGGINNNTRLRDNEAVVGDGGCLACGNCVDQCPVVKREKGRVFIQNQRTSMALETVVQEECRRCYRCVNSCPQVSKSLKEFTQSHRRVEKIVHLLAAFCIVSLAATGITYSHYGEVLPAFEGGILKYGHRFIGVVSIIVPFLYYYFDVAHFQRTLKKALNWKSGDKNWFQSVYQHLVKGQRDEHLSRREFNPGQKLWYLFIMVVFPLLYLSGWTAMLTSVAGGEIAYLKSKMFHLVFALSFDLMLFVHIYIKFIREWIKNGVQLYQNYKATKTFVFKGE